MFCHLAQLCRRISVLDPRMSLLLLLASLHVTAWPHDPRVVTEDRCPSSRWNSMCQPCCEYHLIQCRCPSQGARVGYTVPCCPNALDECDPCIIHPGCSLFENCKSCHNGTWEANDDFFINGRFCTECRRGWSGGDCKTCGGVVRRVQGSLGLESYPTNARCEWRLEAERGRSLELRFPVLSLEPDHSCRYDYVELRDGDSLSSPVIGRFCGDDLPPPMKSSGNTLHILFVSDGYNNFDGFAVTFQENSDCNPSPCLHHGTCFLDPLQSFRCVCAAGYSGQRCERNAARAPACAPPEKPANGDLLPVFGSDKDLVSVGYLCHPPYTLTGTQQRSCLPNATWSGTVPTCVQDSNADSQTYKDTVRSKGAVKAWRCAPPPKVHNGHYKRTGNTVEFFCKNSYILSGNPASTCLPSGAWSHRSPWCVRACREPQVSNLVRQTVVKPTSRLSAPTRLRGGDSGISGELPRGFHHLHTSIEYRCVSPIYRHTGSAQRSCLKTGRWSGRHVSCSPVCGKVTLSLQNVTETQWPWHVAVYLRSAVSRVMTASDQQGAPEDQQEASEEQGAWTLACSGALVAPRSVLVAAHCVVEQQPVLPGQVMVVISRQKTPQDRSKNPQQRLRVSTVLVHPSFDPVTMDSDLAVLRLQDKARLSERVLPVCLAARGGEVTAREAYAVGWSLGAHDARRLARLPANATRTAPAELRDVTHCERHFAQRGADPAAMTDNMLCLVSRCPRPGGARRVVTPGVTVIPSSSSNTRITSSTSEAEEGDSSGVWELLGLESFNDGQEKCRREFYSAQTRVVNFRDWIEKNVK